eukprot:768418-Hanusia_phi.AAC.2
MNGEERREQKLVSGCSSSSHLSFPVHCLFARTPLSSPPPLLSLVSSPLSPLPCLLSLSPPLHCLSLTCLAVLITGIEGKYRQHSDYIKRLGFILLAGEVDQYLLSLPQILERLVDALRLPAGPGLGQVRDGRTRAPDEERGRREGRENGGGTEQDKSALTAGAGLQAGLPLQAGPAGPALLPKPRLLLAHRSLRAHAHPAAGQERSPARSRHPLRSTQVP